jgi:pimeloyl-ACP methyl ester carboxylesterase
MKRRILSPLLAYGGAWLSSRALEKWLAAKVGRYSETRLRQEPQGEVCFIECKDGSRLRAISAGSGRPVILAHGYGISLLEWNIIWDLLLHAGYRVICFDQRGHGQSSVGRDGISTRSMSGDYLEVLKHFAVNDGILVGHSMGGFLALAALLELPEVSTRLSGLVLCATLAGRVSDGSLQNRLQLPLIEYGLMDLLLTSRTMGLLFGLSLYGDHPVLAEIELFLEVFCRQNHRSLVPIIKALSNESRYERLSEVKLPTVVICGRQDRTTPAWHSERLASEIAGARLIRVDGVGHLINWEAPESVVAAIAEVAGRRSDSAS